MTTNASTSSYRPGYLYRNWYESSSCDGSVLKMELFNVTSCLHLSDGSSQMIMFEIGTITKRVNVNIMNYYVSYHIKQHVRTS